MGGRTGSVWLWFGEEGCERESSVLQINKGFSNGEGVNGSPYALRLKQ